MVEEETSRPEEKFEDYTLKQLEVKKRITEEKIQERMEFSIPYRIQKRFGINVYRLAKYLLVIELIILITGCIFYYTTSLINPPTSESLPESTGTLSGFFIFIMIMMFVFMFTFMILVSDTTAPLRRKLKEIKRAIRIKQEVEQGDKVNLDEDESDTREYKSSFKYDYRTGKANKELPKATVKSVVGFLNAGGGHLIIGVSDDKELLGIENDLKLFPKGWDGYQLNIQDAIRDYTDSLVSDYVKIKKVE